MPCRRSSPGCGVCSRGCSSPRRAATGWPWTPRPWTPSASRRWPWRAGGSLAATRTGRGTCWARPWPCGGARPWPMRPPPPSPGRPSPAWTGCACRPSRTGSRLTWPPVPPTGLWPSSRSWWPAIRCRSASAASWCGPWPCEGPRPTPSGRMRGCGPGWPTSSASTRRPSSRRSTWPCFAASWPRGRRPPPPTGRRPTPPPARPRPAPTSARRSPASSAAATTSPGSWRRSPGPAW